MIHFTPLFRAEASVRVNERQSRLRELLRSWRARLRPADVGLPGVGARRVPGLRSQEVAELAEVSAGWYEQFESGKSHRSFSSEFVRRVAGALRLDEEERATLLGLALPEVASATRVFEDRARDDAARSVSRVRDFVRRLPNMSSFEEAVRGLVETVQGTLNPSCATVASIENGSDPPRMIAAGPRADLIGPVLGQCMLDMNAAARKAAIVLCEDSPYPHTDLRNADHPVRIRTADGREVIGIHEVPATSYVFYNRRLLQRSELVVGLFENRTWRGVLSCYWLEPRAHLPVEVATLETLAAIVALIAAPFAAGVS
jgi:transcriptional regulator with XRE-family HTH domain